MQSSQCDNFSTRSYSGDLKGEENTAFPGGGGWGGIEEKVVFYLGLEGDCGLPQPEGLLHRTAQPSNEPAVTPVPGNLQQPLFPAASRPRDWSCSASRLSLFSVALQQWQEGSGNLTFLPLGWLCCDRFTAVATSTNCPELAGSAPVPAWPTAHSCSHIQGRGPEDHCWGRQVECPWIGGPCRCFADGLSGLTSVSPGAIRKWLVLLSPPAFP